MVGEAIDHYRTVVKSDPAFVAARLWFGRPFMQKGMFMEAIEQVEQAVKLSKEGTVSLATLAQAHASAGNKAERHRESSTVCWTGRRNSTSHPTGLRSSK